MTQSDHGPDSNFGALDFEFTDFAEARAALDELPAGLQAMRQRQPGYWERQRREPQPTDRALTGGAIDWMLAIPLALRPKATAGRYPRVVNAIAEAWTVPADRAAVVRHYLVDSRGDRRGFPLDVQRELEALLGFAVSGA